MKKKLLPALIIAAVGVAAGVLLIPSLQNRGVVARVNGAPIKEYHLQRMLHKFRPDDGWEVVGQKEVLQLKKEMLSLLINEELLLQEARKRGIEVLKEELEAETGEETPGKGLADWRRETEKRLLIERLIAQEVNRKAEVTEAEAREYYEAHREEFILYPMVKVYQIFLREGSRAEELRDSLSQGQDFEELARQWSLSPEAEKGGDLGFVRKGDLPQEMEREIFKIAPGEISPVVKSSYGYHIFKVTEVIKSGREDFHSVQKKIKSRLLREKQSKVLQSWLKELRGKARIRVYEKGLL